jgi:hypothetical protein
MKENHVQHEERRMERKGQKEELISDRMVGKGP